MTEDYLQRFGERRAQDGVSRRAVANRFLLFELK